MDINIVWIIAVLLLATGAVKGFRKGLVEGVVRITSYVIGIIVLIVLVKGIGSFIQMQYIKISKHNKKRPYQAYHLCYSKQCSSQSIQPLDYRQSADQPAGVK